MVTEESKAAHTQEWTMSICDSRLSQMRMSLKHILEELVEIFEIAS